MRNSEAQALQKTVSSSIAVGHNAQTCGGGGRTCGGYIWEERRRKCGIQGMRYEWVSVGPGAQESPRSAEANGGCNSQPGGGHGGCNSQPGGGLTRPPASQP
jgi:hypothetical protein